MKIAKATQDYEAWLGKRIILVPADLKRKHAAMAQDVFPFLRATFYRWMQLWPEVAAEENRAPKVLAVGDLHVENFGTWRDREGRLIWGINDFDEAYVLPYALDLVRLATSANLAIMISELSIAPKDACKAILEGYTDGMQSSGCPFVLAEKHKGWRKLALSELRDPEHFWEKMKALPDCKQEVPPQAMEHLKDAIPSPDVPYRLAATTGGARHPGPRRL